MAHPEATTPHETALLTKNRIEALADGVFAIVMTLLVLEFRVPEIEHHATSAELLHALKPLWRVAFSFVVTFTLATVFWITQQTIFNATRRLTRGLTFLALGSLLFVSLLPFSTALLGRYLSTGTAQTIYFGNQCAIALFLAIYWTVVLRSGNTHPIDRKDRIRISTRLATLTLASAAAAMTALFNVNLSFSAFAIIAIAARGIERRMKRR